MPNHFLLLFLCRATLCDKLCPSATFSALLCLLTCKILLRHSHFFLVWFCLVWYGMVWCGVVWFGLVWFGLVCLLLLFLTGRPFPTPFLSRLCYRKNKRPRRPFRKFIYINNLNGAHFLLSFNQKERKNYIRKVQMTKKKRLPETRGKEKKNWYV